MKNEMIKLSGKIFHIIAGLTAITILLLINDYVLIIIFSGIITLISFLAIYFRIFKGINLRERKNWSIFYLPLSFTVVYVFLFPDHISTILIALLIFTFSVPLADIIKKLLPVRIYYLTADQKSFTSSAAFFLITLLILLFSPQINAIILHKSIIHSFLYMLKVSVSLSFILMLIEAISSRGSDKISIPVIASILIYVFIEHYNPVLINNLIAGILLGSGIAIISYKLKFLKANGSAATALLAAFIFGFGGWQWTLPIFSFFVLSSILSKLRVSRNKDVDTYFEKGGTRDYIQVFSNGGLGVILVLLAYFYSSDIFYLIYTSAIASVCADTWGTEIGTMYKARTYNILNFKEVHQGTSGGVSIAGTSGSIAGSFFIAFISVLWINFNFIAYFLVIFFSGITGSIIDSFLGAKYQGTYECGICGTVTEKRIHCCKEAILTKGFKWLNNDLVNVSAALGGGIFSVIILYIFT